MPRECKEECYMRKVLVLVDVHGRWRFARRRRELHNFGRGDERPDVFPEHGRRSILRRVALLFKSSFVGLAVISEHLGLVLFDDADVDVAAGAVRA